MERNLDALAQRILRSREERELHTNAGVSRLPLICFLEVKKNTQFYSLQKDNFHKQSVLMKASHSQFISRDRYPFHARVSRTRVRAPRKSQYIDLRSLGRLQTSLDNHELFQLNLPALSSELVQSQINVRDDKPAHSVKITHTNSSHAGIVWTAPKSSVE